MNKESSDFPAGEGLEKGGAAPMSAGELVRARRSVRTFNGKALEPSEQENILRFAMAVETPYDFPFTWRVLNARTDGLSSPVITGTETYIAGKVRRAPHAEEAFGFAFEKVVLYAASRGIGTTWIAGTMDRPAFERAMRLEEGEVMPCVSPLGYPAEKMSLRESVMRKGIRADSRLAFRELFFKDGFDSPLDEAEAGELSEVLELVRWAPSAVNKQPWRVVVAGDTVHFYEKHSKGYVSADGWDLQKIDMGIALCHFDLGAEEKRCKLEFLVADPGLPAPADTDYIASFKLG